MVVKVHILKQIEPDFKILICGMPGSGYVGKLAVDYLVKELKGELIAEVYSDSFPPVVIIKRDGVAEPIKGEIYSCKDSSTKQNLLIFTGSTQPVTAEGEYEVADTVLEFAKKANVKMVYTMGAYILGSFVKNPKVHGTAINKDLLVGLRKHKVLVMKEGSITGMNGLLFALTQLKEMKGICLLGETSGYVVDAKASEAVLEVLNQLLELKVDMTALREKGKETEDFIKKLEATNKKGGRPSSSSLGYIS
ncbi:MAG: proteasome assembly chaperone family protein [Thaumarchaeota archaeon]|nr:proteasome assembly chaperone family protein [Nitrososphaerota archaeon]